MYVKFLEWCLACNRYSVKLAVAIINIITTFFIGIIWPEVPIISSLYLRFYL